MKDVDLLNLPLHDISDLLCERLMENKKRGICVAGATLDGTNRFDGKRVQLSIVLTEKTLGCDEGDCED